jgi:uncharacterized protein YaiI (UPF0178 family)
VCVCVCVREVFDNQIESEKLARDIVVMADLFLSDIVVERASSDARASDAV